MRALLGVLLIVVWSAAALAEERVALLIGNAEYAHTSRLKNPLNDVAAMRSALEQLGFEVETVTNADERTMGRALQAFRRRAAAADTALLFYSGHGMEMTGRNYLIPVDARLEHPDDAAIEALPLDAVLAAASGASRLSIVVLDACRDARFLSMSRSGARGFSPVRAAPGQLIAFATAPGEVAYDGEGDRSPYTQALTEMLSRPDAAALDVRRLFGGLGPRVRELTRLPQEPFTHSAGFGADIVSLGGEQPRPGVDREALAKQAYDAATATSDPRRFDIVARRFPNTSWGELAALDAADLRKSAGRPPPVRMAPQPDDGDDVAPPPFWSPSATELKAAQTELRRLGRYPGAVDGRWGGGSSSALARFQRQVGLSPADGRLTQESLEALRKTPTPPQRPEPTSRAAGETFRDCGACPVMVVIPSGAFRMGSSDFETEKPAHRVSVPGFALGRTEVTFGQWDACVADGGCGGHRPTDQGWGRGLHPAIFVSWDDAQSYVAWLNRKAGTQSYRLPSEAEWEYAARAGGAAEFSWGDQWDESRANDGFRTVAVSSYQANRFGLHDMHGNVSEWVEDCWNASYSVAPSNGLSWMQGDCSRGVHRGGAWNSSPRHLRSAGRGWDRRGVRINGIGFRVARALSR